MIALVMALSPRVVPGAELGVLYRRADGSGLADMVLTSSREAPNPRSAGRAVGIMVGGDELSVQYITTRGDSGNVLSSIASQDVLLT